ncbi:MAG: NAD-binding protein [Leptolyngbyaceae cyanobacterium T60_A2020_046]|nr:NAD-binding protein [Leptolyngbyaceae cyanobacterium T60_A2020_046]
MSAATMQRDLVLVCGLGSLGQHCVVNLKTFGVDVHAVELAPPAHWEIATLPAQIDRLVVGDCRQESILREAGVYKCCAALMVTTNERVNLEAALTARVLNPNIRLVVRSDKQNLNDLLAQQLDNFVAFEPTQLVASAFALAAFGEDLLGFFQLGDQQFRVVRQTIAPDHPWCNQRLVHELDTRSRRVLRHLKADIAALPPDEQANRVENPDSASAQFYTWLPNSPIRSGDVVVTVSANGEEHRAPRLLNLPPRSRRSPKLLWLQIRRRLNVALVLQEFWRTSYEKQIRRVALLCGATVVGLCLLGTGLLSIAGLSPNPVDAFYTTVVLLLGGYGDLFSDFALTEPIPWWLRLFSLVLTLAGTAFIGVLYALLTEKLLTLKFEFLAKRPPVPDRDHVVIIWLGRVGRQVARLLQDLKQPVVGITDQAIAADVLPQMPLLSGPISTALESANLPTAKSIVAVSDDEMQNLELGLMAHRANPDCRLIIRTYEQVFTDKVAQLFPYAQVLCASALSAEAFAGAAFGENVVSLFRLYHQTVLVTQYDIEPHDTLNGLLLGEVAYGYGVVPIWHGRSHQPPRVMPSDDVRLHAGDRLVVLATIRGLRRIEQGDLAPQQWQVQIDQVYAAEGEFEGAAEIARATGLDIGDTRSLLQALPVVLPKRLYRHQALRLVRLLTRSRVQARVLPLQDEPRPLR